MQFSQETSGRRYNFLFNFVKLCTDLCIAWARQAGRKERGEFRRCWQTQIFHGKMTRASAEGIGLPQTCGGWCRSSLDWIILFRMRPLPFRSPLGWPWNNWFGCKRSSDWLAWSMPHGQKSHDVAELSGRWPRCPWPRERVTIETCPHWVRSTPPVLQHRHV